MDLETRKHCNDGTTEASCTKAWRTRVDGPGEKKHCNDGTTEASCTKSRRTRVDGPGDKKTLQ